MTLLLRLFPLRAGAAIQNALAAQTETDRIRQLVARLETTCAERQRVIDQAWGEPRG